MNQNNKEFEVRRIFLPDEAEEIKKLQHEASEFADHYPNHMQWLNKSIDEIELGKKVAFGVYKAVINPESKSSVIMVGSVILKKGNYGDIVEMKNLFIKREERGNKFGTALCDISEKYCAERGYSSIKTEVPSDEIETIEFLLKRNYKIYSNNKSIYKDGDYVYELYKDIFPLYGGDPFDLFELGFWVLKYVYRFSNMTKIDKNTISFNLDFNFPLKDSSKSITIPDGILLIFENELDKVILEVINVKSKNKNLVFVIVEKFSDQIKLECHKRGILLFDVTLLYKSFKEALLNKVTNFSKDQISGIILSLNPKYFHKILQNKQFSFLKGLNIGKYLKKGDKILFFIEKSTENFESGIRGYGEIIDVTYGSPGDIWAKYRDKNPLFGEEDFWAYVEDKENILGIQVDNFREINNVSLDKIKQITNSEVQFHDIKEMYLDKEILFNFYEIKTDPIITLRPDAPRVFISSTLNDLRAERETLKTAIINDLRYNCYIFEKGGSRHPARKRILEELKKSDIYVCLIGKKYGNEFEIDGKMISGTEDEYNHAKLWNKKILVYVKKIERDYKVDQFLGRIKDYHGGTLIQPFSNVEELIKHFKDDVASFNKE